MKLGIAIFVQPLIQNSLNTYAEKIASSLCVHCLSESSLPIEEKCETQTPGRLVSNRPNSILIRGECEKAKVYS